MLRLISPIWPRCSTSAARMACVTSPDSGSRIPMACPHASAKPNGSNGQPVGWGPDASPSAMRGGSHGPLGAVNAGRRWAVASAAVGVRALIAERGAQVLHQQHAVQRIGGRRLEAVALVEARGGLVARMHDQRPDADALRRGKRA